jgi:RHS repeat-associated protein
MAVKELNKGGSEVIWTSYAYDAMKQLTDVVDDLGNATLLAYDDLGRRTATNSPDAGYTQFAYDLASNLVSRATPNLEGANQAILYQYDFNRMTDIVYPLFPQNGIHYTYGAPGAPGNGAEEIVRVDDASGNDLRTYGKLGEIVQSIRTVSENPANGNKGVLGTYTTAYTYDSYGRLQSMTYPDGEVLTYAYDSAGSLRAMNGVKGSNAYTYASRMEYDKFGAPAFVQAGNGVQTTYTYDPRSRRLATLQAGMPGKPFQNVSYTYDPIGDVLSLTNNVPVPPPSQFGGPSTQTFGYDDLHRLTSASGTDQLDKKKSRTYTLSLTYDTIHNITQKQQTDTLFNTPGHGNTQAGTTYSNAYAYGSAKPHAATHVDGRSFSYDADGNQLGWTSDSSGQRRTIVWDEDDRMESLADNGATTIFQYSDAGDRMYKEGPGGRTIYVNEYYTDGTGQNPVKHFFAGTTRIASKLVAKKNESAVFYHGDHLGNTTYMTDAQGNLAQHLEYFPFGETWIEDANNPSTTPYLFAGKELDGSELYYFGARYYDGRTSLWQSTDPALYSGIYPSINLQLFAYAGQNPVRYTDLDGRASEDEDDEWTVVANKKDRKGKGPKTGAEGEMNAKEAYGSASKDLDTYANSLKDDSINTVAALLNKDGKVLAYGENGGLRRDPGLQASSSIPRVLMKEKSQVKGYGDSCAEQHAIARAEQLGVAGHARYALSFSVSKRKPKPPCATCTKTLKDRKIIDLSEHAPP